MRKHLLFRIRVFLVHATAALSSRIVYDILLPFHRRRNVFHFHWGGGGFTGGSSLALPLHLLRRMHWRFHRLSAFRVPAHLAIHGNSRPYVVGFLWMLDPCAWSKQD